MIRRMLVVLIAWWVAAGDGLVADDLTACMQLISRVADENPGDWNESLRMRQRIGQDEHLGFVADLALTQLLIRHGKPAEAWKRLAAYSAVPATANSTARLEYEKLKLWLLLEARSPKADDQLKLYTTRAISSETPAGDRQDAAYFLGAALEMLSSTGAASPVSAATIEKARALLETQNSEVAVASFKSGSQSMQRWKAEVQELMSTGQNAAEAAKIIAEIEKNITAAQAGTDNTREALKGENDHKKELENKRRQAIQIQYSIVKEMKIETPGKPREPVPPRRPREPTGKLDSKTGRRDVSDSDMRRYNREMDEFSRDRADYERDLAEYPRRLEAWRAMDRARRTELNQRKQQADQQVDLATKALEAQRALVKDSSESFKEADSELDVLQRKLKLALLVQANLEGKQLKLEDLLRPANCPLLDYARQSARLSAAVRKK